MGTNSSIDHYALFGAWTLAEGEECRTYHYSYQPSGCNLLIYSQFVARLDSSRFAATSRPISVYVLAPGIFSGNGPNLKRNECENEKKSSEKILNRGRLNHKPTPELRLLHQARPSRSNRAAAMQKTLRGISVLHSHYFCFFHFYAIASRMSIKHHRAPRKAWPGFLTMALRVPQRRAGCP
jgi:hypothetical protein